MEQNHLGQEEIRSGMIVAYTEPGASGSSWYRVRKVTKNTVNLGSIFGSTLYHKGVPKDQVREDGAAWQERWQQSETYMCM